MRLIKRHHIYGWFLTENGYENSPFAQMLFKHTSDMELAAMYHLTYLRTGYFY